jgi:phosphoribosylformylglycinamidine cyclo-ligase
MAITYRQAGVDIDAGDALVERIARLARPTRIPEVVADVGGFAGLCAVPAGLEDPILVSGTDGVGTKLKIAFAMGVHHTVGIDLVAMCVNDVITVGARPLFFLDYFGTGKLDVDVGEAVVRGIAEGCRQAGCALLGGETAELPGMYAPGEYDLAGFSVGVVERRKILDGARIAAGDRVIAVASSGLHSNGFSLARRVIEGEMKLGIRDRIEALGVTVGEALLTPTKIYARAVRALLDACGAAVKGLSHVTGGGLPGNVPRVLPEGLGARLDLGTYMRPAIFQVIAEGGPVDEAEMRRTFNLGVGLVTVVAPEAEAQAIAALLGAGEQAWAFGEIIARRDAPFEERVEFVGSPPRATGPSGA